jgi:hypothetical protein
MKPKPNLEWQANKNRSIGLIFLLFKYEQKGKDIINELENSI